VFRVSRQIDGSGENEGAPVAGLFAQADTQNMELIDTVESAGLVGRRRAGLLSFHFVGNDFPAFAIRFPTLFTAFADIFAFGQIEKSG
jgi:hypothetical protein